MSEKVIKKYLDDHHSTYVGKYRCHSSIQTNKMEYKFHYYIRDPQFREINVFLTISYNQKIKYLFSVNLHEQEQEYIIKDALNKILYFMKYKTVLSANVLEQYINNKQFDDTLEPLDYRNILDYLEYHRGINQETIDDFYTIFMPFLDYLIANQSYCKFMDAINLLLDKMLYEYEWDGATAKYLDTQYQYHLYYFRKIIIIVHENIEQFYQESKETLLEAVWRLCTSQRFAFAIMVDFGTMVMANSNITKGMIKYLLKRNKKSKVPNYVISYLKAIFESDKEAYNQAAINIIRFIMDDMLTFANHDLQLAIGNALVASEGYDLLINLFAQDYNTFVFVCFPISTFPDKYREVIKDELEQAIRFYAARMEHDEYRLSSFEQVFNINRLFMENYKEYGKDGK